MSVLPPEPLLACFFDTWAVSDLWLGRRPAPVGSPCHSRVPFTLRWQQPRGRHRGRPVTVPPQVVALVDGLHVAKLEASLVPKQPVADLQLEGVLVWLLPDHSWRCYVWPGGYLPADRAAVRPLPSWGELLPLR